MKISKEKEKEIIEFIERYQPKVPWDYNDTLSDKQVVEILENGIGCFGDELYEHNIEYIFDLEKGLIESVQEEFELEEDIYDIHEHFLEYIHVDLNVDKLLDRDITCLAVVYSNYDCATSWQTIEESEEYLGAVWQRVKHGCKKEDYLNEFRNSYTASLLCFAFKTDIETFIELEENFKKEIFIPKGTQYSFFSSFNGSGGMFEAETYQDMVLPKFEPEQTEYDCVELLADIQQSYGIKDVYGGDSFINNQDITVK